MANRHLSRSIVLQSIFEIDFNNLPQSELPVIIARNIEEFGPGLEDSSFIATLADTVIKKRSILDEIITKAAPEWPIDKISIVDRNILRVGLAELVFGDRAEVPPKVAINEAIELAKTFGGENSSKFINGVLGAVYKELGEPDKDQVSKKKMPVDPKTFPLERLGGAVVYTIHEDAIYLALVHDIFGYWTLSKGRIEEGEDESAGAVREIKEEIGLDVSIEAVLGENEYVASHPEKGKTRKHVYYFLAKSSFSPLSLESSGGLNDARWFPLSEIADLKIYDDIVPLITKAVEIITKQ